MVGKIKLVLRYAVKKLEKLPRSIREIINRLLDLTFFARTVREKISLRRLALVPATLDFKIDRSSGFTKFEAASAPTSEMISFALACKKRHLDGNSGKGNSKDYLRQIWDLSKLGYESSFILEWALKETNLKSISEYFQGKLPILHEISIFYSPETTASENGNWQGSQLFHMDGGGTQCVKLWLLCQDVNTDQGPTVVVSADQSARLARKLKYSPGTRIEKDEILESLESLESFALVGPEGTWYATDTDRSFHYGSRTTEKSSRLVIMFHYVDNNSSYYMPILSKHYRRQLKRLPEVAKTIAVKSKISYDSLRYRLNP